MAVTLPLLFKIIYIRIAPVFVVVVKKNKKNKIKKVKVIRKVARSML